MISLLEAAHARLVGAPRGAHNRAMAETFLTDPALESALRRVGVRAASDLLALGPAAEARRFVGFVDLAVPGTVGQFHLKRYRYDGWGASKGLLGRGTIWGMPPEVRAFHVLGEMRRAGVPAVRPVVACAVRHHGRLVAHALLTEAVPEARDLAAHLRAPKDPLISSPRARRAVAASLGAALARLHGAGMAHRDLHARNILVRLAAASPEVTLLDCRRGGPLRRGDVVADLARLDRDLVGAFTRRERWAVLCAYAPDRARRRALAMRVGARRERLAPPRPR